MNIRLATYYHAKDVPALPGSNIFHSTELFHVLEQTRGVRPLLLVAYEGKSPVGKLLCITRRSTNLLRFAEKVMRTAQVNTFLPPIRKNIFSGTAFLLYAAVCREIFSFRIS